VPDTALLDRWRELNSQHSRVLAALDRALERAHDISACELDVMQRLAAQEGGSQRMQDLADSVLRSQSTISRMAGRLESLGLVKRDVNSRDRRGVIVTLTSAGRKRITEAEGTQRRVLAEMLQ
jgi:DNA-binding MarR family transcriptional regulator